MNPQTFDGITAHLLTGDFDGWALMGIVVGVVAVVVAFAGAAGGLRARPAATEDKVWRRTDRPRTAKSRRRTSRRLDQRRPQPSRDVRTASRYRLE
jgi:hypothetical protein